MGLADRGRPGGGQVPGAGQHPGGEQYEHTAGLQAGEQRRHLVALLPQRVCGDGRQGHVGGGHVGHTYRGAYSEPESE